MPDLELGSFLEVLIDTTNEWSSWFTVIVIEKHRYDAECYKLMFDDMSLKWMKLASIKENETWRFLVGTSALDNEKKAAFNHHTLHPVSGEQFRSQTIETNTTKWDGCLDAANRSMIMNNKPNSTHHVYDNTRNNSTPTTVHVSSLGVLPGGHESAPSNNR